MPGVSTARDTFDDMTPEQRLRHVQALWDRIAENPDDAPVTDAQRDELDRRLAAHRASPDQAIPWDAVKRELLQRR